MEYNSVFIAGTPRTGSMWTTNIIFDLFKLHSFIVKPENIIRDEKNWLKLYDTEASKNVDNNIKYVFKTHVLLKLNLPRSKYIVNIRNPFDICASFYEFMKCDIERAIQVSENHINIISYYENLHQSSLFKIRYEDIENNPIKILKDLCHFFEINYKFDNLNKIYLKYQKENVKKLINKNDVKIDYKIKNNKFIEPSEIVFGSLENYRSFDLKTGFQTRHISSRNSGEWKLAFSKNQIEKVLKRLSKPSKLLGYFD